jgi:hypothetical protein
MIGHELRFQLNAGDSVDNKAGILRGVTVAKAGVDAQGKFLYLDQNGDPLPTEAGAVKKLAITTDETTLDTLLGAIQDAGGRLKVRSDHDDAIQARAGYAVNFRKIDDRVVCDIHLNDSYRDREIVLEVAKDTPELIGLSIDFMPSFQLEKDTAIMRVGEIYAVDIVDAGAITPSGLYMQRETVDKKIIIKPKTTFIMASTKEPTMAECMASITECMATIKGVGQQFTDEMGKFYKMAFPNADKKGKDGGDGDDGDGDNDAELKATIKSLALQVKAATDSMAAMRAERVSLGLNAEKSAADKSADAAAEAERVRLAKEKIVPKTYLELLAEKKKEGMQLSHDRHAWVLANHPEAYQAYLNGKVKTGLRAA